MENLKYISELSKCVRCGSCKAFCPTYNEGLTEGMGARGRLTLLRGLLQQQLKPTDLIMERIFSCILCGACESLCSSQVQITEAVYHGRRLLMPLDHRRQYLRHFMRFTLRRPLLSYRVMKVLQYVAPFLLKKKTIPFRIKVPPQPLRDDVQVYKPDKRVGRVGLFTGCAVNFLYPHLGACLINVLLRLGYEVILPKGEVCCGAPLRGLGLEDEAIEMAEKNQKIFSRLNIDSVLSLCPTCLVALKNHYPKLIGKGIENAADVSSFLCQALPSIPLRPPRSIATATYHDPCHLIYSLGIRKEPRRLIQHVGVRLLEAEGEGCCGFGGIFSLRFQEVSRSLRDKRINTLLRNDADAIVTACPGCMTQLSDALPERQVLHVIELFEESIC